MSIELNYFTIQSIVWTSLIGWGGYSYYQKKKEKKEFIDWKDNSRKKDLQDLLSKRKVRTINTKMSSKKFWVLIENSLNESNNDYKVQLDLLRKTFCSLTVNELLLFDNYLNKCRQDICSRDFINACQVIMGNTITKSLDILLSWIICKGHKYYSKSLSDIQHISQLDILSAEEVSLFDVLSDVYFYKTGELISEPNTNPCNQAKVLLNT